MVRHWDSAIRGSSALRAGLMRRLLDEVAAMDSLQSLSIFWDVEKFYDSISVVRLVQYGVQL
eukprot:5712757-Lingulodinium_polyedra.AAC.1